MKNPVLLHWFYLSLLVIFWGSTFALTKYALDVFSPLWIVAMRLTIGFSIIYSILRIRGEHLPRGLINWLWLVLVGMTAFFPFYLICWGTIYLETNISGILFGIGPLFTVIAAHFLVPNEKLNLIKFLGIIFGFLGLYVLLFKDIENSSFFCSKNLVINGSLYVKNGIHNNKESNIFITELTQRSYSSENIVNGTTQWSNVDITTYTDRKIYIDGDIIVSSNIITDSSNYNDLSQYDVLEPYKSIEIDNITLKDNIKISNSDIILKNENVEINAKEDITLLGNKIYIDGDINFQYRYANVLKEIYEHSVIYNSIGSMQKRTAFTGQIPIRYGSKHELGYDLKWSGTATNFDIFKLEGEIFLTDTITKNGFRILSDFVLTINPFNNSQE